MSRILSLFLLDTTKKVPREEVQLSSNCNLWLYRAKEFFLEKVLLLLLDRAFITPLYTKVGFCKGNNSYMK